MSTPAPFSLLTMQHCITELMPYGAVPERRERRDAGGFRYIRDGSGGKESSTIDFSALLRNAPAIPNLLLAVLFNMSHGKQFTLFTHNGGGPNGW